MAEVTAVAAVTVGPSVLWYLTRATGAMSLVMLTASVIIGIALIARVQGPRVQRFIVDGLHRTVSLLSVVFLAVHIVTAVLDTFAPISLRDAFVPFGAAYRPLWMALGAASGDLLLAIVLTSLIRRWLGYTAWRRVHWLAYLSWPVAVVHGFGTGSDARASWMLLITLVCIGAVLLAVVARVVIGWPEHIRVRLGALGVAAAFAVALVAWLPGGPLARGWSRRAGTPAYLLSTSHGRT